MHVVGCMARLRPRPHEMQQPIVEHCSDPIRQLFPHKRLHDLRSEKEEHPDHIVCVLHSPIACHQAGSAHGHRPPVATLRHAQHSSSAQDCAYAAVFASSLSHPIRWLRPISVDTAQQRASAEPPFHKATRRAVARRAVARRGVARRGVARRGWLGAGWLGAGWLGAGCLEVSAGNACG